MKVRFCAASLVIGLFVTSFARADAATYAIDPARSSLTLAGTFQGFPFGPQGVHGMVDNFSGTISADLSGSTLTFSGGSSILGLANPDAATFVPAGTGTTNYGVQIPAIPGQVGAYRDLVLDFLSGSVGTVGPPSAMIVGFTSGRLDYAGPATGAGTLTLVGSSGPNTPSALATLITVGGVETLTLPISVSMADNNGLAQTLTGQIVATRSVPEPSVLALLALTISAALLRRPSLQLAPVAAK